jgi:hypothetical protein
MAQRQAFGLLIDCLLYLRNPNSNPYQCYRSHIHVSYMYYALYTCISNFFWA